MDRLGCLWDFLQTCHLPPFLLLCSHFLPSREISGHGSVNICNSLTRLAVFPGAWWSINCGSEPFLRVVVHNPSDPPFTRTVDTGGFFSGSHFSGILSSQLLPDIMSNVEIFVLAPVFFITVRSPVACRTLSFSLNFVLLHQTRAGFLLISSSLHFQSHVHNFFLFL